MSKLTIVTPDAHRAAAIELGAGHFGFSAGKTTDANGAPPPTHWLASCEEEAVPAEVVTAFENDARFSVHRLSWQETCQALNLFGVIEEL